MLPRSSRGFNRLAVEGALRRAIALWGRLSQAQYPNGAVIFCSEALAEAVHPPRALQRRVYSCGRHFDTSMLREQLQVECAPAYGIIAIDGSEAYIGTAQGLGLSARASSCAVSVLARISSSAASRTRRGGQSALRYSRLRDEADLAFIREVAQKATSALRDVRAVVLAGKGDARHRLQVELPQSLRSRVLCSLALPCDAGQEGLRLAAARAGDAAASDGLREKQEALARFMELIQMPTQASEVLAVYGKAQTLAALSLGAVETLLVPSGEAENVLGATAGLKGSTIVEVDGSSEQGATFIQSFGVGGCLRWPVDSGLLDEDIEKEGEENGSAHADVSDAELLVEVVQPQSAEEVDLMESGPEEQTGPGVPQAGQRTRPSLWLQEALQEAFGDATTAESLVMCVEVLLDDDSTAIEELLVQATDVLIGEGAPQAIADEWARRALSA